MVFLWCAVGCAAVLTSFFFSPGDNIWMSLETAGIAAAFYLLALITFTMRAPFPGRTRVVTWGLFLAISAGIAFTGSEAYKTSCIEENNLEQARLSNSRGVMLDEMPRVLLQVLQTYYAQTPDHRKSIGEIFRELHCDYVPGCNINPPFVEKEKTVIYVSTVSDHEIALVGQELSVRGNDLSFRNYDGRVGMVQARAILTPQGVRYETEN
jgi:hypothetical protein